MAVLNLKKLAKTLISYLRISVAQQKITECDICQYFKKNIKIFLYQNYHQAIIKRGLIKKGNAIIIQYNYMKYKSKLIEDNAKRKRRRDCEDALSWSKRIVLYLKRQRALAKLANKENQSAFKLQPDDIEKLNERLRQYKDSSGTVVSNAISSLACFRNTGHTNQEVAIVKESNEDSTSVKSCLNQENRVPFKGMNFLDSLINKLKKDETIACNSDKRTQQKVVDPASKHVGNAKLINKMNFAHHECESSDSSEFLGFSESEAGLGLLSTPAVPRLSETDNSAFVSEKLDAFLRENFLENRANIELPKYRPIEDGMVCEGAQPPKIAMPKFPDDFAKVRTVAEKRLLFERKRGFKYFIIENENTIYRELKRRAKYGQNNESLVSHLQTTDIPFTRDCWKAASWLRTSNGKFCFQMLTVNGNDYKLMGSRGDHSNKVLGIHRDHLPFKHQRTNCPENCKQQLDLKDVKLPAILNKSELDIEKDESNIRPKPPTLITTQKDSFKYKPKPLSKKFLTVSKNKNDFDEVEIYEMPSLQLEVSPEVNQPLDERVKSYLKLVLPSEKISREWAEFAVSTLVTRSRQRKDNTANSRKSFTFDIPYLNNQKTLLVRKIYKRNERFDEQTRNSNLTFRKNINLEDDTQVACADVLTEMIDSVALGLSEDALIQNDPDIDYKLNQIKEIIKKPEETNKEDIGKGNSPKDEVNKASSSKKLLKELRRLNATIVEAQSNLIPGTAKCTKPYCTLGCVCHSLMGSKIGETHCKRVSCMFSCVCQNTTNKDTIFSDQLLSKEDAILIREKATARLAKVEKEFCATVVLTDNQTYLLNESQTDKRRTKRLPKRFSDFVREDLPSNAKRDCDPGSICTNTDKKDNSNLPITFRHCDVNLRKLKCLENIEPWCMVHCLYKCFCKGDTTQGQPFKFDQEEIDKDEAIIYSRKREYSLSVAETELQLYTTAKRKYYSAGYVRGSRSAEIPSKIYVHLNRDKAKSIKAKVESAETNEKKVLLQKRIAESSKRIAGSASVSRSPPIFSSPPRKTSNHLQLQLKPPNTSRDIKPQKDMKPLVDIQRFENELKGKSTDADIPDKKLPVITSVVSLNSSGNNTISTQAPICTSFAQMQCPNGKISPEKFHANAIAKLNLAVTRTMQSICNIQKRNSKHVPLPAPKTLCSLQWKYFLRAFIEELVFVWLVGVGKTNILVATKTNIMPQVRGAISAANIKVLRRENLPLLGKMLVDNWLGNNTKTLTVLLSGHNNYWHVIGFTNSKHDYLTANHVVKPTPKSHPQVSSKVNDLYKLLVLREMESMKRLSDYKHSQDICAQPMPPNNLNMLNLKNKAANTASFHSNLQFKSLTPYDAKSIIIPIPNNRDHTWMMMALADDFSHIYIPAWKDFLTYDRIRKSFSLAYLNKKTVRLANLFGGADIYATSESPNRIYIGPFYETINLNLVLLQNVDGKLISREDFEKSQNLKIEKKTVAYWLRIRNSALVYDFCSEVTSIAVPENTTDNDRVQNRRSWQSDVASKASKPATNTKPKQLLGNFRNIVTSPHKYNSSVLTVSKQPIISKSEDHQIMPQVSCSNRALVKRKSEDMQEKLNKYQANEISSNNNLSTASYNAAQRYQNSLLHSALAKKKKLSSDTIDSIPSTASQNGSFASDTSNTKGLKFFNPKPSSPQSTAVKSMGYFVSNNVAIGKIVAEKIKNTYRLKLHNSSWLHFSSEQFVLKYLAKIVQRLAKEQRCRPRPLQWRYVEHNADALKYPMFSLEILGNWLKCSSTVKSIPLIERIRGKIPKTVTSSEISSGAIIYKKAGVKTDPNELKLLKSNTPSTRPPAGTSSEISSEASVFKKASVKTYSNEMKLLKSSSPSTRPHVDTGSEISSGTSVFKKASIKTYSNQMNLLKSSTPSARPQLEKSFTTTKLSKNQQHTNSVEVILIDD